MDRIDKRKRARKLAIIADRLAAVQRQAVKPVVQRQVVERVARLSPRQAVRAVRQDKPPTAFDRSVPDHFDVIEGPRLARSVRRDPPPVPHSLHAGSRLSSSAVDDVRKAMEGGCKERPKDNRPSSSGGGSGRPRRFVPWCD